MSDSISDAQHTVLEFTKQFKKTEGVVHGFKEEMNGKLDNIFLSLDNKVGTYDMKVNFKIVSDIMYVKFK